MKTGNSIRFDALALLASPDRHPSKLDSCNHEWLAVAVEDAQINRPKGLRAFLWHYGRDVRKQRGSFRPLTEIYLLNKNEQEDSAAHLFKLLDQSFPDTSDALSLKQDLIDGLLVPVAQCDYGKSA